jgi:PASTA domain
MPTSMFTVQAAATTLTATAGTRRTATFQVSNLTDQPQRLQLQAVPTDPVNSVTTSVDPPQLTLEARGSGAVTVAVADAPGGTSSARFRLRAYSANLAPEETEAWSETVEVVFSTPAPPAAKPRRVRWWIPVAVVAAIALVGALVVVASRGDEKVAVPIVRGGSVLEAVLALDEAGLEPTADQPLADIAAQPVVRSIPEEGTKVNKGASILLVTEDFVKLPNLVGQRVETARRALDGLGLQSTVVSIGRRDPRVFDEVVSTDPAAGKGIAVGRTVTLRVKPSRTFPRFTTVADARELAGVARLKILVEDGPDTPAACVVRQKPAVGTPIQPNGTVVLRTVDPTRRALGRGVCALVKQVDLDRLIRR